MKADQHRELSFLIKAFARFSTIAEATIQFREMFGKNPTPWQIANSNLGRFMGDKRKYFKDNWRVRKFRQEREKYEASIGDIPIMSPKWRAERYQWAFDLSARRAQETGNVSRLLDIMTLAAKDAGGYFTPKTQNITVDNRVQTYNSQMSDDEINRRIESILKPLGISLKNMPLIRQGDHVIDSHAEDVEIIPDLEDDDY